MKQSNNYSEYNYENSKKGSNQVKKMKDPDRNNKKFNKPKRGSKNSI
jgi:hypothetical protein